MKILLINKFLHANGGSETYIFKLGEHFVQQGHQVQYFGMEHESRVVGNAVNAYTTNMDFHEGAKLSKLTYPIKTIYSAEARKKLHLVLDDFKPDVCHLNNFNFQLTPSIILEIVKWRKENSKACKIIYTAHDYQLICPNHMCRNIALQTNCEQCTGGHFLNCVKNKCIHGSTAKSLIGAAEAIFWNKYGVYKYIDEIICCSHFMKRMLDTNPVFAKKTVAMHNFVDCKKCDSTDKKDYVLYFGRYSQEKGISTLIQAAKQLPLINFVFAGSGPLENDINGIDNIKNVGFCEGEKLNKLISQARFTVYPSQWYENCPFSIMESQMLGTPVLAANIGGIPELVSEGVTGELFESGNVEQLKDGILSLCNDAEKLNKYTENCKTASFCTIDKYCDDLIKIYS